MDRVTIVSFAIIFVANIAISKCSTVCSANCPEEDEEPVCGFDPLRVEYSLFAGRCAYDAYQKCHSDAYREAPIQFCLKLYTTRRRYTDSCPVFCPEHYRPVCGASELRSYAYRTFINGCYLDMINCRGSQDSGYVEVELKYCGNHLMKNFFHEKIIHPGQFSSMIT